MIYEGTNGVQALDLVGRKLLSDRGEALTLWSDMVKPFIAEHINNEAMKPYLLPLMDASTDLEKATGFISGQAVTNPDIIGAASMPYMQIFGITALAWMWTRTAAVAVQALEEGVENETFYRAKLTTAEFYMSYWAVQTRSLRKQVESASLQLTGLCEDDF